MQAFCFPSAATAATTTASATTAPLGCTITTAATNSITTASVVHRRRHQFAPPLRISLRRNRTNTSTSTSTNELQHGSNNRYNSVSSSRSSSFNSVRVSSPCYKVGGHHLNNHNTRHSTPIHHDHHHVRLQPTCSSSSSESTGNDDSEDNNNNNNETNDKKDSDDAINPDTTSSSSASDKNTSPASWGVLSTRLSELREKELQRDRQLARNWHSGVYGQTIIASVPDDFYRKVTLDGDFLACGTVSGTVCLHHLPSHKALSFHGVHKGQVTALAYGGSYMVSAGAGDNTIAVWDCSRFQNGRFWAGLKHESNSFTFASAEDIDDGDNINNDDDDNESNNGTESGIDDGDGGDVISGQQQQQQQQPQQQQQQQQQRRGVGGPHRYVRGADGNLFHSDIVTQLAIDDSANRLYTASKDGFVNVYDLTTLSLLFRILIGEPIYAMTLLVDKKYLLLGCASGRVLAFEATHGTYLLSIPCHDSNTTALAFYEDSQTLVTGDARGNLKVWSFRDSRCVGELPGHDGAVMSIQIDHAKVVSAGRDGCVRVAMLNSLSQLYKIDGFTKFLGTAVFDDTRLIADGTNDVIFCHYFDVGIE